MTLINRSCYSVIVHQLSLLYHWWLLRKLNYKILVKVRYGHLHSQVFMLWCELVHHNLFITLLLGSKEETLLVKQPWYIQTKMYRLYRKMTIYIIYTFLGSIFKPFYIQTSVITNGVIKRLYGYTKYQYWQHIHCAKTSPQGMSC